MSSIHELLKQVYPLKLRMELFNAIWTNWREDVKEKDQRIAELEEQLKKKPKYNVGDRIYVINEDYEVERDFIESIDIDTDGIEYYTVMYSICWYENQLFATKEEALAKLRELGEKND